MTLLRTIRDVSAVAKRAQVSMLAASLGYFGFTSLLPMALLAVVVFTVVADEATALRLVEMVASGLGADFGEDAARAVLEGERRLSSSVVGAVVLLWSAQRLYGGTDRAFAAVYGQREEKSLLASAWNALVVFLTNLLALSLLGALVVVLGLTERIHVAVGMVALFAVLVVVFLPMYYLFPLPDVTLAEVLPGTAFAAATWAVSSAAVGLYASRAGGGAYGAATAVVLLATWLYVGGLALLIGATLNAVLADRVDPDEEWVPME